MTWGRLPLAHVLAGALCIGLALANVGRLHAAALVASVVAASSLALVEVPAARLVLLAVAVALAGWWWASVRLDELDRSPMPRRSAAPAGPSWS
jgi:membrane protein implicated in regulation of membrane protease activity